MKRTKTNLPVKQQPVIDTEEVFMTLETMEATIIKSTELVAKINTRLSGLNDQLVKLGISNLEDLTTLFAANRMRCIDKFLNQK